MSKASKSGSVLKELLTLKGVKQAWLASKLSISPSALHQRFVRQMSIEFIIEILNIIGSDLNEFNELYKQKESTAHPTTNSSAFTQQNMNA